MSRRDQWTSWVQEQRAADLAAWQRIEELGARIIEFSGTGIHPETVKKMANELCDLEYDLTGDTQVSSKLCDELGIDTGEETDADMTTVHNNGMSNETNRPGTDATQLREAAAKAMAQYHRVVAEGEAARACGTPRAHNPHFFADLVSAWFEGWDRCIEWGSARPNRPGARRRSKK